MELEKQLNALEAEHRRLEEALARPELAQNPGEYQRLSRRYAELSEVVETYRRYRRVQTELAEAREMLRDPELKELAEDEVEALSREAETLEKRLQTLLLPKDEADQKNAIVEIRAGTGGEEAALFARDLFEMYRRYAEKKGFGLEVMDAHPTDLGGFSKIVFRVEGPGAYGLFKFESGVHRVQRVPATETQGRIHTSTATVAVLPEAEEKDLEIKPEEIRIDVMRASGPGGQGVNTTDSAVRVVHLPTGIIVTSQESRSQIKNRERALTILRSRLLEMKRAEEQQELRKARLAQIGTGERSEKIRTYNFPQSRVTDHRIHYTTKNLEAVLSGDLDELHQALVRAEQERMLAAMAERA